MFNRKNTYLVSISVSNRIKELFYKESVPEVEDVSLLTPLDEKDIILRFFSNTVGTSKSK